jgi:hypothetical protein
MSIRLVNNVNSASQKNEQKGLSFSKSQNRTNSPVDGRVTTDLLNSIIGNLTPSFTPRWSFDSGIKGGTSPLNLRRSVIAGDIMGGSSGTGWTEKTTKRSTTIYEKTVQRNVNGQRLDLQVYQGVRTGVTDLTTDQFLRAARDVESYVGNIDYVKESFILSRQSDEIIYYNFLNFGFGIKRHFVNRMVTEKSMDGVVRVSWEEVPLNTVLADESYPKDVLDKIRSIQAEYDPLEADVNEGYYEYDANAGTVSQVILNYSHGATIPSWAINSATSSALPNNISQMIDFAKTY